MSMWLTQFLSLLFHLQLQATYPVSLSSNINSSTSKLLCSHEQSDALLQFKKSFSINISASSPYPFLDPPPYPRTESWKEGSDCCFWDGITCDLKTGYVIGIDLSSSMLYGTFYSNNSVFFLSHLQNLNLSYNNFVSSLIPSQFSQLLQLTHLNLSWSNFEGPVPSEISHLSSLVSLDLSWNYGLTIETSTFNNLAHNLTKLRELNLNGVNMSLVAPNSMINLSSSLSSLKLADCDGLQVKFLENIHSSNLLSLDLFGNFHLTLDTIQFNTLFLNLPNLRELDLTSVNMSLVSPNALMNLSYSLSSLKLVDCGLLGEFPGNILRRPYLRYLDLSGNEDLTSISPKSNWSTSLQFLDVSYTKIPIYLEYDFITNLRSLKILYLSGCNFIGSNLALFGNLMQLTLLDLSYNNFSGQIIPSSLGNLEQLTLLSLSSSNFSGQILSSLGNLKQLVDLDLSNNNLTGQIPSSLGNLKQLVDLDISNNNLTGEIPSSLGNLKQLVDLDISNNNLTGQIPSSLGNLKHLVDLDLSNNNLTGQIPSSLGNLKNLVDLDFSNNNLTGQIPSSLGNFKQLVNLDLSNNNLTGQIPSSLGNLKQLVDLDLFNNNLTGQIPSSLGNLNKLNRLHLFNNNLNGPISNSFANLAQLQRLELSNNRLIGPIPSQLGNLKQLIYLDLSNNNLSGLIPNSFANFSQLNYLKLSNNQLIGPIPSSIFNLTRLEVLILSSNNKLNGQLSSSVCKLQSLQILDLSNNSFNGIIPQCLGNFSDSLLVLHLGRNNFRGTIPSTFSKGSILRFLNLNGNQLQGKISPSIINCTNLEILDLGNNEINDTFPYFLESLPELQILVLRSNKLYGSIRSSNSSHSFPKLRMFDLSNNNFSGPLPTKYFDNFQAMIKIDQFMNYMGTPVPHDWLFYRRVSFFSYDYSVELTLKGFEIELVRIQTILTTIDLSSNKFTGEIPQSIGKLKSLKLLNLSHNSLRGKIPPSIRNLTDLETLDLSSNLLTGRIPTQLAELTSLEVFRVADNQLEGPIPEGKQFNTFDSSSYEGNSRLCGFLINKACNNGEREKVKTPPKEDGSKSKNGFGWESVFTGYASGVVFGLTVGYLVFRTRKPEWFVRMVECEGYHLRAKWLNNSNNTRRTLQRRRRRN